MVQEEAEEMMHQLSHMIEQQRMSMDQYLMLMRKTREEYLKELEPDAEKRVKRQLVLDAVMKQEEITVAPEEIEALARAYTQMGQPLPRTDAQLRALAQSLMREKTVTRLVELTAGPDPDAENEDAEAEEATLANAEAAALAGEAEVAGVTGVVDEAQPPQPTESAETTETTVPDTDQSTINVGASLADTQTPQEA